MLFTLNWFFHPSTSRANDQCPWDDPQERWALRSEIPGRDAHCKYSKVMWPCKCQTQWARGKEKVYYHQTSTPSQRSEDYFAIFGSPAIRTPSHLVAWYHRISLHDTLASRCMIPSHLVAWYQEGIIRAVYDKNRFQHVVKYIKGAGRRVAKTIYPPLAVDVSNAPCTPTLLCTAVVVYRHRSLPDQKPEFQPGPKSYIHRGWDQGVYTGWFK